MKTGMGLFTAVMVSFLISACSSVKSTIDATPQTISTAVDSNRWQFVPQQVIPAIGRSRQVSSDFVVQLRKDTLQVYLPYYGRANAGADVLSGRGPLDFTSTQFSREPQHPKTGEWNIALVPGDHTEVRLLQFQFFSNGSASLEVLFNSHSSIRYTGTLQPLQ